MDENRFWILASKQIAGELSVDETTELELLYIHYPQYRDIISNLAISHKYKQLTAEAEEKALRNLRLKIASVEPLSEEVQDTLPVELPEEQEQPRSFWATYKKKIVLSSFLVTAGLALLFMILSGNGSVKEDTLKHSENNIATRPGSRSQVKLPDGTNVILNSDSKLSYPDNFLGNTREVTLEGEAYFEVTENKSKPFVIHLPAMDIKVLGTTFNVKAYPGEQSSEASLIKGSIEVTLKNRRNEKIILKPNEKISVLSTGENENSALAKDVKSADPKQHNTTVAPLIAVAHLDMDEKEHIIKEIGWTQNKLMFRNEDLGAIATTLQRWYGRPIDIQSEKLKSQKFTGNFNNESLMQVIQALQVSYNFNYKTENNSIIIY
ncbi:FecR family protein [Ferruginibacter sp. HRS2-29]|uniref:FecR family protein n=1 Tax=Ferruginibacter sp. HRS2-29 TaxID=2487334 RepID=UPI0020CD5409|nr:FecR family protein [Ferruginibacter sp. HRS2-29]MCP9749722.1 FecR family protein [Ferruginibacter sp. HRS2-29]